MSRAWSTETEQALGPIDLLVANAGISGRRAHPWELRPGGVVARVRGERSRHLPLLPGRTAGDARARQRPDRARQQRRLVPACRPRSGGRPTARARPRVGRFGEYLAAEVGPRGVAVFQISPGPRPDRMTDVFGPDMPWTPPEPAPQLVRVLASGRADALAGRYLHAEHDDIEQLIGRADEVVENDLNAIRLNGEDPRGGLPRARAAVRDRGARPRRAARGRGGRADGGRGDLRHRPAPGEG